MLELLDDVLRREEFLERQMSESIRSSSLRKPRDETQRPLRPSEIVCHASRAASASSSDCAAVFASVSPKSGVRPRSTMSDPLFV